MSSDPDTRLVNLSPHQEGSRVRTQNIQLGYDITIQDLPYRLKKKTLPEVLKVVKGSIINSKKFSGMVGNCCHNMARSHWSRPWPVAKCWGNLQDGKEIQQDCPAILSAQVFTFTVCWCECLKGLLQAPSSSLLQAMCHNHHSSAIYCNTHLIPCMMCCFGHSQTCLSDKKNETTKIIPA